MRIKNGELVSEVIETGSGLPECNWNANGYRLPTEAEWEKAARGWVAGKNFPWGTDMIAHSQANYISGESEGYNVSPTRGVHPTYGVGDSPFTAPVGSFSPNGYGLHDMAGNVSEWCWDWYGSYTADPHTDPRGTSSGPGRACRGGSWSNSADACRVANRSYHSPEFRYHAIGFRVVRNAAP
jgi:formylglycine-generating enzyme required for sulfatase activity